MVRILVKLLNIKTLTKEDQRSAYGKLCGIVGIALNLLLFIGKFFAGMISHSVAITADAFNNLSDAGSSIVTLVGFKLAEQKPDSDHPFGHGRMEYVSGLLVAGVILMMAYELLKDSIDKILHPEEVLFSPLIAGILITSIFVKCYMAYYNFSIGKQIGSATLKATATDSFSDCISTMVVLISAMIGYFTELQIDGFCGVAVGMIIFIAGIKAVKETLDPLLGQATEKEYVEKIEKIVTEFDKNIIGVHDIIVHDYGPGRQMISLHAEVRAEENIFVLHDIIDNLERELRMELGCDAIIHMDPMVTNDKRVDRLKAECNQIVKEIGETLTLHDFRVVFGENYRKLIFDIIVPYEFCLEDKEIVKEIQNRIWKEIGENYLAVIHVDKPAVH